MLLEFEMNRLCKIVYMFRSRIRIIYIYNIIHHKSPGLPLGVKEGSLEFVFTSKNAGKDIKSISFIFLRYRHSTITQ